ncbi:MAG: hypothetical protein JWQ71_243 [Pedosphaera sp.]|nr:hypothetical protein [Pedosphaera sp.]
MSAGLYKKAIPAKLGLLRTQLILLTLLILCPVFALGLYGYLQQRRIEKASVQEKIIATSRLAAAGQKDFFDRTRQTLATLTQFPFLIDTQDRSLGEIAFYNFKLLSPDYLNFGLIETNGVLFCNAARTNRTNKAIRLNDQSYFQQVARRKHFSIGNFQNDPLVDEPCLNFGYPVANTNGPLKRVIFASLKLSVLSHSLSEVALDEGGISLVIDPVGNVLAAHPHPEKWVATKAAPDLFIQQVLKKQAGLFESSSLDGTPRLYAITPVTEGNSSPILAVVGIPRDASFAHANSALARNLTVMAIIAALALVAARIFAQRLLLRPINALVSAANRLSRGDLSARAGMRESANELNQLAQAFDAMAENLATRQKELERANEAIKRMNAELEQRVKERTIQLEIVNQELEAFSYSVSHDLRAPLRHMSGFAQFLSDHSQAVLDEKGKRYLNMIKSAAKQMGSLIEDLLSFAQMGRQQMHNGEVDMNELVQEVIAGAKLEQGERQIEWVVLPLPKVRGDAAMLRQVWVNFIANAVKYTRRKEKAHIEIGWREEFGKELVFFVKDNGAGFDMKYAQKLFGIFQRLHEESEFEGTGIGLANVRRIIHRHSGRTWGEGEVEKGATFYFSLTK